MPPVRFDAVRGGFVKYVHLHSISHLLPPKVEVIGNSIKAKPSIAGQAASRASFLRERWGTIKEVSGIRCVGKHHSAGNA